MNENNIQHMHIRTKICIMGAVKGRDTIVAVQIQKQVCSLEPYWCLTFKTFLAMLLWMLKLTNKLKMSDIQVMTRFSYDLKNGIYTCCFGNKKSICLWSDCMHRLEKRMLDLLLVITSNLYNWIGWSYYKLQQTPVSVRSYF